MLGRRLLLRTAAAAVGTSAVCAPVWAADPLPADAPNAISGDAALQRLMDGNGRFVANQPMPRNFAAARAAQVKAQYPIAGILGCADSRVSPITVFDQGPGDVFAVRVAGNVADDDAIASFEYAVHFLGVPLLMVLGHSNCGAVSAAVSSHGPLPGHLPELIREIEPAVREARRHHPPDLLAAAIAENARLNAARLARERPVLAEAVKAGRLKIAAGVYDLATGRVVLA